MPSAHQGFNHSPPYFSPCPPLLETYFSVDPLPEYWVQLACTNPAAEGLPGGPAGGLGCLAGPRALPDWVTDAVPSPLAALPE